MKTNEGGAGFGTIGKERGKLLTAVVVAAVVLACCAMLLPVDAEDTAPEIAYTEISPENFLALDTDDDGVISLEDNYRLAGPVVLTENIKIVTNGKSMITSGDMFRIGADGIDVEIDATAGGSLTAGESGRSSIIWGNYFEANVTVTGGVYTSDDPFTICGNNKNDGLTTFSMKNATVNGNTSGIWLSYGAIDSATIENCNISGGVAMYIATVQNATISGCTVSGVSSGIEVKAGMVEIEGCTVSSENYLVDDTVGMSASGGSEAPITINNGYCGSAQVTAVDVTISNTTVTCEAEGYTPVVVTSYYEEKKDEQGEVTSVSKNESPISVTWDGASNSDVTFCPTQADAMLSVNGFVAVDTAERLNAAVDNGSNVVLAGDITSSIEIGNTQNIIIDLNGFTLTNTDGSHTITNNGTLTVIDSSDEKDGTVDNTTNGKAALYNAVGATAILNGGIFERSAETGVDANTSGGNSYYTIQNQGTMTVNDGVTVKNDGKYSSCFTNGWYKGTTAPFVNGDSGERVTANLTINGGMFEGGLNTIKNDDLGVLTVNGGLFTNYAQNAFMNAHIAVVNDGVFDADTEYSIYCYGADPDDGVNEYIGDGKLTLNGGSFSGGIHMMGGSTLATDQDGIVMVSGNSIMLENGAKLDGTLVGPDGNIVTITGFIASSATTITAGSFVIDGSWIGEMTLSGDDIVIIGTLSEDAKIIVKPLADGTPTNITWRNFDQNGANIIYQDSEGNDAEPSEVANQIYENATMGDVTIDTAYPEGGYVYDGEAQPLPQIEITVTDGQVSTSGFLQVAETGAQGSFVAEDGLSYYWATSIEDATIWHGGGVVDAAINVGAYTVKYGYAVDGFVYVVECSWTIEKATLIITVDQDKEYDGQDMSYDITNDDVSGLGAGDSITGGTITTTGSDVKDYTVEGQDWAIDGLSTVNGISNYEIVISSVSLEITPRDLTIVFAAHDTYDGDKFAYTIDYPNSEVPAGELVINGLVDGESVTGTLTTNDSIAKVYTYNDGSITAEITVSSGNGNYNITYSGSLTIDKKDVTVSGATIADKVYDGSTSAVVTGVTFDGLVGEDSPAYNTDYTATAVFDDANAGTGKTLSVTVTMIMGSTVLNNYNLPTEATELDGFEISKAVISIASATVDGKVYDGTENWNVSAVSFTGLVSGESLEMGTDYAVSTVATWNANAGAAPNYLKYADVTVTLSGGLNYTFDEGSLTSTITNVATSVSPIVLTEDMIHIDLADAENGISMTVSVSNEDGLSPTGFTTSVTGPDSNTTVSGSNPYTITQSGTYTISVSISGDSNWSGSDVTKEVEVELNTARFFTAATMEGGSPVYSGSAEQTVVGTQIVLPNANDVPEGYVLAGWIIGTDGTTVYTPGTYFDVPVSGVDLYAVYEKDDGTPVGPGPEPAAEPTVTIDMPDEFVIGVETEFSVSTTKGDTTGTVYVKGTGSFEGIPGVDYNIWYLEVLDGQWHAWDGATFGPSTGFPLSDAIFKFKVQFINAGAYDLTVQIVTADNGDVVCETAAVVNVPAENTLGYHIQNAVDFVYANDPDDYNADTYTYKGVLSSSAGAIVVSYGYDYYEALLADLQSNTGVMSDKTRDIMNDFARYMGALYRSADGDVGRVYFDGTEYVWKADAEGAWLNGSNWRDADGDTLTEDVVLYIMKNQTTRIVMEVASNGISAETLTYSVQFDDAPIVVEQYTVQFQDQDGNVIETVTGLVSGSAVLLPRTIVVNDVTYDVDSWTIGTDVSISADIGYYFVDPVHATEGTIIMVASVAEVQDPVTVTYYDGSQVLKVQVMYPGEFFEFPQVSLATGETFEGWYSDSELNTPAGTSLPDDTTGTYSLYAKIIAAPQEATYEIVFMNGTQTLTYSGYTGLTEGTTVALPSSIDGVDASKFRLNGWFLEGKLPMTTYTVRGIDAVDGKITVYADIVQYSFEVTANTTENGTFTTFLQNGTLMVSVFPNSGYAVDTVSVMAGDEALSVIKSSDTLYYVSIESDVTVSVTFKDVSGVQDPEDVSTMVDVSIGSLSDGVQVQLDALVGILPSDVDVSVTYYFQTEYEGMTGYGSVTVSNNEVQIPAENNGRWNVDFDLTSSQNYGSAYLGFATVTYTIGEVQYEFESLLTNIIHVPVTS